MKRARNILVGLIASVLLVTIALPPPACAQFVPQPPGETGVRRMRPVWQLEEREQQYSVRRPVYETSEREERYTVRRPVYENSEREVPYTVQRPVVEVTEREVATTVYEPVIGQRAFPLGWGGWPTRTVTRYVPRVVVRSIPTQTVRYVEEQHVRKVDVQTVRYVDVEQVRKVPVRTVRYVEEQRTRMVKVPVLRWVEEEQVVAIPAEQPVIVRAKIYVPGHPIRNLIQAVTP